jgi:hypothetical protein
MGDKQSQGLLLGVFCVGLISVGAMVLMDSLASPNDASVLCRGRYKRLGKYFTGLTISDLKRMDQDAFYAHAERRDPRDALLMRDFLKEHTRLFRPSMEMCAGFVESQGGGVCPIEGSDDGSMKADLAGWPLFRKGEYSTVDRVLQVLRTQSASKLDSIISLDVRGCGLDDERVGSIVELLKELPACSSVDLRDNDINGDVNVDAASGAIRSILARNMRVNITGCAIVRPKHADAFLRTLSIKAHALLIWIPAPMLEERAWYKVVPAAARSMVTATHEAYYDSLRY